MKGSRTLLAAGLILAAAAVHVTAARAGAIDLLDILFGKGRSSRPGPSRSQQVLENGRAVTGLAGSPGTRQHFQIDVRPGTARLTVGTTGGAGDCDLYLSHGALPEPKSYQYVSNGVSTDEGITIRRPATGTWHVLVYGYRRFGGVNLTAAWSTVHPHAGPGPRRPRDRWIRIVSPTPGVALTAGETYWLQWATSGHSRRVRVLQSFDDGTTWTDIAPRSTALAGAGRIMWTVPLVHGRGRAATVRVRVVDMDTPLIHATSAPWAVLAGRGGRQPGRPGRPGPGRGSRSDPYEPNNQSSRASRIEANSVQHHRIHDEGDRDWLVFVPPAPGTYRVTFTDVTVELKVRLYSAVTGSSRENKYRTFTVKKRGYSLDFDAKPTVRYFKLHVEADDDDDTGSYRIVIQRIGHVRPPGRSRGPIRR